MGYLVAADTGGTFTDFVAFETGARGLKIAKSLTDYGDPMRGVSAGFKRAGVAFSDVLSMKFGTTLVINAFLQRRGVHTALVATKGFRDTLEIRRGNRAFPFDLKYRRDPALVQREDRYELDERMDGKGGVVRGVDLDEVGALTQQLGAGKYDAIAVSFVNSYLNDEHERVVADALRKALPDVFVTTGTELTREWYEYERASTAAANAYVGPLLDRFLNSMERTLAEGGFPSECYLMASNGGVSSLEEARRQPIQLVESGPVGGCIGAAAYARVLDLPNVIAFDMGGTTAKCAIVRNGQFETQSPYYVGGNDYGFPIRTSVIDIVEVGAGGGSIASVDDFGNLQVGPRSAGSTPGPACYGRGGADPTITDANVVLGRIGPGSFLGGEFPLDIDAAAAAVREKVGKPLGYDTGDLDHVAQGILDIGAITMSEAISTISIERGLDPREFALFVFGGGGPVHGGALARELNIPMVIVPPQPGLFSCVGMLLADATVDENRTMIRPLTEEVVEELAATFSSIEAGLIARLPPEIAQRDDRTIERFAEMRYKGQRHALKTNLTPETSAEAVARQFHAAYSRRYGHADESAPIEIVSVGVTARAPLHGVDPAALVPETPQGAAVSIASREVYFKETRTRLTTPIYSRDDLAIGTEFAGPVIIEEYGSSTIVGPNDRVVVGPLGELRVSIN